MANIIPSFPHLQLTFCSVASAGNEHVAKCADNHTTGTKQPSVLTLKSRTKQPAIKSHSSYYILPNIVLLKPLVEADHW
jgi:hypothetical protein